MVVKLTKPKLSKTLVDYKFYSMKTASLIFGILAILGMLTAFFPCLGSLNWLNIPFATIGLIISVIALAQAKPGEPKGNAIAGLVLCSIAMIFGMIRLIIGGGIL